MNIIKDTDSRTQIWRECGDFYNKNEMKRFFLFNYSIMISKLQNCISKIRQAFCQIYKYGTKVFKYFSNGGKTTTTLATQSNGARLHRKYNVE
jgi:hypothetical protein